MLKLLCTRLYSCLSSAELKGILKKASPACLVWLRKWMCCKQILFSELSVQCSREKCFPIGFSLFPTSRKSSDFQVQYVAQLTAHGSHCSVLC